MQRRRIRELAIATFAIVVGVLGVLNADSATSFFAIIGYLLIVIGVATAVVELGRKPSVRPEDVPSADVEEAQAIARREGVVQGVRHLRGRHNLRLVDAKHLVDDGGKSLADRRQRALGEGPRQGQ